MTVVNHYILRRAKDKDFTIGVTDINVGNVTSYADTTPAAGQPYYYKVLGVRLSGITSDFSSDVGGEALPSAFLRQAVGRSSGGTIAGWAQNTIFSTGSLGSYSSGPVNRMDTVNPGTDEMYQHVRFNTTPGGTIAASVTGLSAGAWYLVRCHYYAQAIAPTVMELTANGIPVAEVIYAPDNSARVCEFYIPADGSGNIALVQKYIVASTFINGVEVIRQDPPSDAVTKQIVHAGDSLMTSFPNWGDSVAEQLAVLRVGNAYNQRTILRFAGTNTMRTRFVALPGDTLAGLIAKAANLDTYYNGSLTANELPLLIGHNNLVAGDSASSMLTSLAGYVAARIATGWRPWVATVPPGLDITGAKETERLAYNAGIRSAYPTRLLEFALATQLLDPTNLLYFYTDGVHITTAGKAVMTAIEHAAIPV